jgi:hypothetical protein
MDRAQRTMTGSNKRVSSTSTGSTVTDTSFTIPRLQFSHESILCQAKYEFPCSTSTFLRTSNIQSGMTLFEKHHFNQGADYFCGENVARRILHMYY